MVIVYCDDERVSREAAKTFVDRGVDNIFLLTGGMLEFAVEFPFYIEGDVPSDLPNVRTGSLTHIESVTSSCFALLSF